MEQITIFDMIDVPDIVSDDIYDLTEEQIVNIIEGAMGLSFQKEDNKYFHSYISIKGPIKFDVHLSHYTCLDREGQPFISCGFWNKKEQCGSGNPADSLDEAISFFRKHNKGVE